MTMGKLDRLKQHLRDLKGETYAVYLACRDPRVPWYARALAAATIAYFLSPIDLIPDPIPILGYLDDLLIVPLGIALVLRMIPAEVMAECRERARGAAGLEGQRNWYAAAVVIAIWLLVAALAVALAVRAIRR